MVKPRKEDIKNVPTLTQKHDFRRVPKISAETASEQDEDSASEDGNNNDDMIDLQARHPQKGRNDEEDYESDEDGNVNEHDDDDDDEMNDDELVAFTQGYSQAVGKTEDDDEIPEDPEYEVTDFSQQEEIEVKLPSPKKQKLEQPEINVMYLKAGRIDPIRFMKGDAWTKTQPPEGGLPPEVWVIDKLFMRGLWKLAECHVFVLMEETILGYNEKTVQSVNNGSKYVMDCEGQIVKLQDFYHRIQDWDKKPTPKIFFDDNHKTGAGWSAAFGFKNALHNRTLIPLRQGVPSFVDCFAGAGGMSCGLVDAGLECLRLIDHDEMAQATLERNHPGADVLREDLNIVHERVKNNEVGYEKVLKAEHGHASPPCQGSSVANTTGSEESKRKENEKSLLFPKQFVLGEWSTGSFENVTGMLRKKNLPYLQTVMHELLLHTIQVRVGVLDTAAFGVPQSRKRLFLLAAKSGYALPEFPEPTHGPGREHPFVTAKDAIGYLEDIEPRDCREEPRRIRLPDGSFHDHHTIGREKDYEEGDQLLADKPAHTIICKKPVRHYNGQRNCSNLERAVLQTFPAHWKFSGKHADVKRLIGNAVPPLMAYHIGKCIMECYEEDDYMQQSSEDVSACLPTDIVYNSPDQSTTKRASNRANRVSFSPKTLVSTLLN